MATATIVWSINGQRREDTYTNVMRLEADDDMYYVVCHDMTIPIRKQYVAQVEVVDTAQE